MCSVCKYSRCPPECPQCNGISILRGAPIAECEECGAFIYENDTYYEAGRFVWCAECGAETVE